MYNFFNEIALESEEKLSEKRVANIKAAVLSRIKGGKTMKTRTSIKTLTIAATVAATAAMSAMLASAEKPATIPTKQPAAAIEQSTPATTETPKDADEKASDKENVADTENKSDIQTYPDNGKWIDLELPNGKTTDFFVPDGKVPMTFDSVRAAIDYANSHSTPSTQEDWVTSFDGCDNFAVWLVDA